MNNINSKLKQLVIAILATQGVAFTATATSVPISPIITGASGGYSEEEPNVWLAIDSTCSMYWKTEYNTDIVYELPLKPNGSQMPKPSSTLFDFNDPFLNNPINISDTECKVYTWNNFPQQFYKPGQSYCSAGDENCRIWLAYYSNRIRTLKSSMSLALFSLKGKELLAKTRVGYKSYNDNDDKSLPLKKMYGASGANNIKGLHEWLFALYPDKSQTKLLNVAKLYNDIKEASVNSTKNNPFLVNPGEAYQATSNKKLMCRRNSVLNLTDGQWDITENELDVIDQYDLTKGVNVEDTLNDGKVYTGKLAPYISKKALKTNSCGAHKNYVTMADVALAAWKADMDNDAQNNILPPKWNKDAGDNIFELSTGGATQIERQYWHPFNDPANWQHITTYSMGFDLTKSQTATTGPQALTPVPSISPPNLNPDYVNNTWRWDVKAEAFSYGGCLTRILDPSQDLANAALAGRGRYYEVQKPQQIIDGFTDLFNEGGTKVTIPAKTGSSGVAGNSQKAGNSYFSSRYDAAVFNGELMKYKLFDGSLANANTCFGATPSPLPVAGTACTTPEWNVGKTLIPTDWNKRDIITAKVDGSTHEIVDFKVNKISNVQKNTLKNNFPNVLKNNFSNDNQRINKLFNYVKGDESEETTGKFRSRNDYEFVDGDKKRNILGAIVRSSPVFVGLPTAYTAHLDKSKNAYSEYIDTLTNFKTANTGGENEIIYVGANDGMLHAIKVNDGKEVFAYVPNAVYENLPKTVEPDTQTSLNDGNIDVQLVNFGIDEADDNNNDDWQRVLVGSMGGGAKGLYALNVTTPTADKVKLASKGNWEFSDNPDMGNIMAKPAIIQLQDNTWAAVVGNGYNATNNKAALFVINLQTGELIQKLEMPTGYSTGSANGLGPLYFASHPNKAINKRNYYDRAYAGDLQGNLWVFDLSNAKKTGGITVVNNKPLFTAKATVGGTEVRQPITVAPKVVKHPLGYGNLVHFGTGALFDRDDLSSKIPNSIYGIWDDWIASDKGGLAESITRDGEVEAVELNNVTLAEATVTPKNGTATKVRYLDNKNKATKWKIPGTTGTHRGWKVDLITDGGYERAWQPAQTAYGSGNSEVISYNTVRYVNKASDTDCIADGTGVESWQLVFNPEDFARGLSAQGALDLNKDGKYDNDDITKADGTALITEGGKTIIPIAEVTVDSINYNSSDQDIDNGSTTQSGCRLNRQTKSNSSSGTTGVTVQRCAYFSSWKELK